LLFFSQIFFQIFFAAGFGALQQDGIAFSQHAPARRENLQARQPIPTSQAEYFPLGGYNFNDNGQFQ
jgi:hypothetical protein